jgi:hypothetical protein
VGRNVGPEQTSADPPVTDSEQETLQTEGNAAHENARSWPSDPKDGSGSNVVAVTVYSCTQCIKIFPAAYRLAEFHIIYGNFTVLR